jgi:hypothetical protein
MRSVALQLDGYVFDGISEVDLVRAPARSNRVLTDRLGKACVSQCLGRQSLQPTRWCAVPTIFGKTAQGGIPRELVWCDEPPPKSFVQRFFEIVGGQAGSEVGDRPCDTGNGDDADSRDFVPPQLSRAVNDDG